MRLSTTLFSVLILIAIAFVANKSSAQADSVKQVKTESQDPIYEMGFDENPEPPGGQTGYSKYLADNLKYPKQAIDASVQGTVYISIVIRKDGKVEDVKIKKDRVGYGCGDEAVRVIKNMPPWKPAKMNGRAVSVRWIIPVKFILH